MRLIDAEALCEALTTEKGAEALGHSTRQFLQVKDMINQQPTIDPESLRPKGEWTVLDECRNEGVYCSICHKKVFKVEFANVKEKCNFCPNCGADMRAGRNEP